MAWSERVFAGSWEAGVEFAELITDGGSFPARGLAGCLSRNGVVAGVEVAAGLIDGVRSAFELGDESRVRTLDHAIFDALAPEQAAELGHLATLVLNHLQPAGPWAGNPATA